MERQAGAILHKMSKAMVRNFTLFWGRSEAVEISIGEGHEVIYVLYCTGYCADNGLEGGMSGFGRYGKLGIIQTRARELSRSVDMRWGAEDRLIIHF